ncbi:MAG: trigger factor, partial [Bacteroidales bacterium]|nr:trigger factor [Candidatus Latescibacterota bacterium]
PMAYGHALQTKEIHPFGEPVFRDINDEKDKPLSFKVDVEIAPVVELKEYKGLAGKMDKTEVTDEEVEKVLENLREREVQYEEVEREATTADMVVISYAPIGEDGQVDEEKRIKDYPVQLGAGQLFPEFELAIVGKKAGEDGDVAIDYPEDYKPERLAGINVKYSFTLKEVKEKKLPEIDDEFVNKLDESLGGVDGLKTDINKRLLEEKERDARRKLEEETIDKVIEKNPFEVPLSMVLRFKKELESEDEKRRQAAGVGPEEDEEKKKEIDEFFDKISRRNIKRFFLVDHIAKAEEISIGDEDMDKEIERLAEEGKRPIDEVKKVIAKGSDNYNNLKGRLREKMVFEALLKKKD